MPEVEIKKSNIHGQGLFAVRDFKVGEVVVKWNPKILTEKELNELPPEEKHFILRRGGKIFLMQSPERFVNYSCDPNTHSDEGFDVAIRNITAGEEITSDYAGEDSLEKFKCRCGSSKCQKIIK